MGSGDKTLGVGTTYRTTDTLMMRIIRRAKAEDAKAIEKLHRELNTQKGYDPDTKIGFIKYRRHFS